MSPALCFTPFHHDIPGDSMCMNRLIRRPTSLSITKHNHFLAVIIKIVKEKHAAFMCWHLVFSRKSFHTHYALVHKTMTAKHQHWLPTRRTPFQLSHLFGFSRPSTQDLVVQCHGHLQHRTLPDCIAQLNLNMLNVKHACELYSVA